MSCFNRARSQDACGQNIWTELTPRWTEVDCAQCLATATSEERAEIAQSRLLALRINLAVFSASVRLVEKSHRRRWWPW